MTSHPDQGAPGRSLPTLQVALGSYPHTRALKDGAVPLGSLSLAFAKVAPINRAFAPMVQELRYDVSELAIVTFLQAKASGCPLVLLPAAVASRFQEAALLCLAENPTIAGPADLKGRRVGVRSYSQTTGVWLRGLLRDDFGLEADDIEWTTFEGAHVRDFEDPAFVRHATGSMDLMGLLRAGDLDAVIVGNDVPADADLRTVYPDPVGAATRFRDRHGFMPVNHVLVARRSVVDEWPDAVAQLLDALAISYGGSVVREESLDFGAAALQPSIDLVLRYATEQGLLARRLGPGEVWDGLPTCLRHIEGSVR